MLNAKAIGQRLSALRGGKTQKEVAQEIGITCSALSMYECGERIPRDEVKLKLAKYYKQSVNDIFFAD